MIIRIAYNGGWCHHPIWNPISRVHSDRFRFQTLQCSRYLIRVHFLRMLPRLFRILPACAADFVSASDSESDAASSIPDEIFYYVNKQVAAFFR